MAMPPCGTFDYHGVVPAVGADGSFACDLESRDRFTPQDPGYGPVMEASDQRMSTRLVGWAPRLLVHDAGLTPNSDADRPLVARHALRLQAQPGDRAHVQSATLVVESTLVQRLQAGDLLHLVRTRGAGIGLSVLRNGQLVVAIGVLAEVPLGAGLSVSTPWDLMEEVGQIFRRRDRDFQFLPGMFPCPLEVRHGSAVALVLDQRQVGPFEVSLLPGGSWNAGASEAAQAFGSICHIGVASRLGAKLTARLLAQPDGFEMVS